MIMKEKYNKQQETKFLAWLRLKPSCVSGRMDGIQAAHVRRVSEGAGIGVKPRLYAVPLSLVEHFDQHQYGELTCLKKHYYNQKEIENFNAQDAKDWFDRKANEYRESFLRGGE